MGDIIIGRDLRLSDTPDQGLCLVNRKTGRVVMGLREFEIDINAGVDDATVVLVKFYASEPTPPPHEPQSNGS